MPRNKFMGKKGDYGMNNMTADAFLKVIHRPTMRVQGSFVEVMVLLQKDGFETAVQEAHQQNQSRHKDGKKNQNGDDDDDNADDDDDDNGGVSVGVGVGGGGGGEYAFEFDAHTIVAKMAIMRHKGFKHKAAGCHGGSNTHIPGVGQHATKAELLEMFGVDDVEKCVSVIINEQISKELNARAKMATRARVYAERQWKVSGLGVTHRHHWSVATHDWLSPPRADVVETIMLVGLRLISISKPPPSSVVVTIDGDVVVDDNTHDYDHNHDHTHNHNHNHVHNHNHNQQSSSLSSPSSLGAMWLPNELWIVILMHVERTQLGSDTHTGVGVSGGSKVRGQTAKYLEEANTGTKSKNYSKKRFKNKQNKSTF